MAENPVDVTNAGAKLGVTDQLDLIVRSIRGYRYVFTTEADLQRGIEKALQRASLRFTREHRLSRRDRIDFHATSLFGSVGIEVKVDGARAALLRQLARYMEHASIDGLIVVASRSYLLDLPDTLGGKPLRGVYVERGAL